MVEIREDSFTQEEILRLAGVAEQYSVHVFAAPILEEARHRGLALPEVAGAEEVATNGVEAHLADGTRVRVGKPSFVEEVARPIERPRLVAGRTAVHVSTGDRLAGVIVLPDPLREQAAATVQRLREQGAATIAMVTGDVRPTAEAIAAEADIDQVHAETTPRSKVQIVRELRSGPVMMVGDGINDAPVLAAANVGIAMAGRGATATSESASAVITSGYISRAADVVHVGIQRELVRG